MKITPLARAATHARAAGRWCGPTSTTMVPDLEPPGRLRQLGRPAARADGNDR